MVTTTMRSGKGATCDLKKLHAGAQHRAVWDDERNAESQSVKRGRDIAVNL